jgi:hypothetical protein
MRTTAAAPSVICEEFPAVMVPSPPKAGRSPASDSAVVSAHDRRTLPARHGERFDLLGLDVRGGRQALVRPRRPRVLLGARDAERAVALLRRRPHGAVLEGVGQPVVVEGVDELDGAVPLAGARPRPGVWGEAHGLLAEGDDDVDLAGVDEARARDDRLHAGEAHGVDGDGGNGEGDVRTDGGLPCGVLARGALEDLPADDLLHLGGVDTRTGQRGTDGVGAELGRGDGGERPVELHERGAGVPDDDGAHARAS